MQFYKKWGLAIAVFILAVGITWALRAQQKAEDKKYSVTMTIQEWDAKLNQLEWVKQQIKLSDMPTRNGLLATDSIITPLVQQIYYQINMQLRAEQNHKSIQIKDSTSIKAKKN